MDAILSDFWELTDTYQGFQLVFSAPATGQCEEQIEDRDWA
jgi:hypothetical protein